MSGAKPDTWMPFYIGDYLADTMHLDGAEHGAYLLLLFAYWRNGGPLPDDDKKLAAIARTAPKRWAGMRPTIAAFFEVAGGMWRHGRVEKEIAAAAERVEIGKARTKAATEARRNRNDGRHDGRYDGEHDNRNDQRNETESPSPLPSPLSEAKASAAKPPDSPLDLKAELWRVGKEFLGKHGYDAKKAGSILGGWRKEFGDSEVLDALASAQVACASEPVEWIIKALKRRRASNPPRAAPGRPKALTAEQQEAIHNA